MEAQLQSIITVTEPNKIGSSEFAQIAEVVKLGQAVEAFGLDTRLKNSQLIAFAKGDSTVASVGAIKHPQQAYVLSIAQKSGYSIAEGALELGYVSTRKAFRRQGLAEQLCAALCAQYAGTLFATTSSARMRAILSSLHFSAVGSPWESELHKGQELTLWVRLD